MFKMGRGNMKKLCVLLLMLFVFSGCATTVKYYPYTEKSFPSKSKEYSVVLYTDSQRPSAAELYWVIGKVEVSGHVNDGVTHETLTNRAKGIARKKGADAIINVKTQSINYEGMYVIPGHVSYHEVYGGRHEGAIVARYHPQRYVPYSDILLTFQGDLIVFSPSGSKSNK